jgi:hypothetical protein
MEVRVRLSLLFVLLAGCPTPGPAGDDSADTDDTSDTADTDDAVAGPTGPVRAQPVCGPDDGVGMNFAIGLAAEGCDDTFADTGHLRLSLWDVGGEALAAGTYAFDSSTGAGWYDPGTGIEEHARSGELVIASWDTTAGATGTYRVVLDSGVTLEGSFSGVPLCEGSGMCG